MHGLGSKMVCITDGSKGAYVFDGKGTWFMPPYPDPAPPVDRTGAGDSFIAGILIGILDHPEDYQDHLVDILDFATGIGALTTRQKGAIPSLPSMEQIKVFLANHSN